MKPINKYILIEPVTEKLKTNSGILLTGEDSQSFRYKKANVVESSDLVETVNKGDCIYYDKAQAHEVIIKDQSYVVIQERDVVVVL